MDTISALSQPSIMEHFPVFTVIIIALLTFVSVLVKKIAEAYSAGKQFVAHAVDEKVPEAVGAALEGKAPAILDKIVAARLSKHEEFEGKRLETMIAAVQNEIESVRLDRDARLADGFQTVMDKLTGMDSRLQVVQIRLESHEARLHAMEQVVHPLQRKPARKDKKKKVSNAK